MVNDILYDRGLELCVSYWDSSINNWGDSYYLNINTKPFVPDSNRNDHVGGSDQYPWISEDGKVLFFQSDNDAGIEDSLDIPDLYVSYLLVDENGDSVINNINNYFNHVNNFELYQNYPNPFNSTTKIKYKLNRRGKIKLSIFDITGKKITELVNNTQPVGIYEVSFNSEYYNLASGIYVYKIETGKYSLSKKLIYIK